MDIEKVVHIMNMQNVLGVESFYETMYKDGEWETWVSKEIYTTWNNTDVINKGISM